jgi:hypothetical protein
LAHQMPKTIPRAQRADLAAAMPRPISAVVRSLVSIRPCGVQPCVDDEEREALRAEGLDPDDPVVVAALHLVRWELSLSEANFCASDTTGCPSFVAPVRGRRLGWLLPFVVAGKEGDMKLMDWIRAGYPREVRVHLPVVALWFRRVRNDRCDGPRFRHWQD